MSQDYIALEWVKGEIEETLQQAQQTLEAYVEDPEDKSRLKFCLSYLHQIHGTLQIVEFYGAALLAEEMEAVAEALTTGQLAQERQALEVLMQAILQLPHYLEHVKVGRRDLPVVLLPILNELRSARGESLLSETVLFNPTIQPNPPLSETQASAVATEDFLQWARKIRQMLQAATLQLLQNKQPEVAKQYLAKAFSRLNKTLGGTPQGIVWLPALAFSEWLAQQQHLPNSARQLLRQLDTLLKDAIEQGVPALNQPASDELVKNLLFYVARTQVRSEAIGQVQQRFNLAHALPTEEDIQQEREALAGPDRSTIGQVLGALIEEIILLKDQLDLLVRGNDDRIGALQELAIRLKQIADTMGMLGIGMPRRVLQDQQNAVARLINAGSASDEELLDIAGALLYVEATLSGMQREGNFKAHLNESALSDAQKAVLREARNVLEQVKDAIVAYIANHWASNELVMVPEFLRSIEGSLAMIPLPQVAAILALAADFVEERLIEQQEQPEWSQMDTFADVLSGVEYYLDRYSENPRSAGTELLDKSEHALESLTGQKATEIYSKTPVTAVIESEELDMIEMAAEEPEAIDAPVVAEETHAAHTSPAPVIAEDEDELIDEEIIEIFLEEAQEVHDTILEFWPQFKANQDDKEALTTVRRSFHTLKGSGRMVKALVIGELAWSIENMFNRVLDNTIQLSDNLFALVDHVVEHIPALIDDFRLRQAPSINTQPLMDYAFSLAAGNSVTTFDASISALETTPEEKEAPSEKATPITPVEEPAAAGAGIEEADEEDSALLDIFDSEARSHLEVVDAFIQASIAEDYRNALTDQLQRALHTLKGSAHMAHLEGIASIATPLERLVKELRAHQLSNSESLVSSLSQGSLLLHNALDDRQLLTAKSWPEAADFLTSIEQEEQLLLTTIRTNQLTKRGPNPEAIKEFMSSGMESLLDADRLLARWREHQDHATLQALRHDLRAASHHAKNADLIHIQLLTEVLDEFYQRIDDEQALVDDELVALLTEAHEELLNMLDCIAAGQDTVRPEAVLEQLRNWQFNTANESHDSVELELAAIEDDSPSIESFDDELTLELEVNNPLDDIDSAELLPVAELIEDITEIDAFDNAELPLPELTEEDETEANDISDAEFTEIEAISSIETVVKPQNLAPLDTGDDAELLEIFLEEAQEISESVEVILDRWRNKPEDLLQVAQLQRELHTLKGGARMAELSPIADLCHELETLYEYISGGRLGVAPTLFSLLERAHDELNTLLDTVRSGYMPAAATHLVGEVHQYLKGNRPESDDDKTEADLTTADAVSEEYEIAPRVESAPAVPSFSIQSEALDEADREILEIFLEEAEELQQGLEQALQDWQQDHNNTRAADEALRVLHTMKGGANLAGLRNIGEFTHQFESSILRAQQGRIALDAEFFTGLVNQQDQLHASIEQVQTALNSGELISLSEPSLTLPLETQPYDQENIQGDEPEPETESVLAIDEPDEELPDQLPALVDTSNVVPLRKAAAPTKPASAQPAATAAPKAPQELVRVSADLLDSLVNLAGETSIGRGRLEQQVSDFAHTLEEMDATLDRLRDQLRRLDMETEAQVLFRQERQGPTYEDFDPLEMDRYSTIQQLSRALVESTSDLTDLKETLTHRNRDAETLLLQQSRVNTELQEGLMKTRMVPFQQLVPRLRRIVRQVGQELGKQVELQIHNASGEMDRSILERMISPLEHMLRNALDHGIENADQRAAAGKPAVGTIDIDLSRDGGDVLISVSDDGRGINVAAVRKKAVERGLIAEDSQVSEAEIMQFILQAGFSTAQAVTQISGRGVGMDVVASEIKQMGGSIDIQSQAGVGSRFVIRVPFTVSVNRALMIKMSDDLYAVPLNNIQGIVRIPAAQLMQQYQLPAEERIYHYAGVDYRLDYLGTLLESSASPKLAGQALPVPVLLVRGTVPFALQVDSLLGSREIVVKTLGPQFAGVMGVSGGTILGDGSVVIILDLPAMIRAQTSAEYQQARALELQEAERRQKMEVHLPKIMVVDDSVTVRKVTTRLLERNGMEVITAKDGVDAISTLQEQIPDLILLDIEMPRMDGFEVASQIRHSSRLKHIPIIMITSRTGDKHRDRAMSIGVNEYMGKPFQEDILLGTINQLLERAGN